MANISLKNSDVEDFLNFKQNYKSQITYSTSYSFFIISMLAHKEFLILTIILWFIKILAYITISYGVILFSPKPLSVNYYNFYFKAKEGKGLG